MGVNSVVQMHAHCVVLFYLLVEKNFHEAMHTQWLLDTSSQSHFSFHLDRFEELNILGVEEHESDSASSSVYFVRITAQNDSLKNDVHWVTLDQVSVHDRWRFRLFKIKRVDSKNWERSRREVIVVIKWTEEMRFVIFFYFFGELCLLSTIDASWKDRFDKEFSESHWNQVSLVWFNLCVI